MRDKPSLKLVLVFLASAVLALVGLDAAHAGKATEVTKVLAIVFKPLTTALLFLVLGRPDTRLRKVITVGMVFAFIGDAVLLSNADVAFPIGLLAFLLGHISYIVAFLGVREFSWRPIAAFVVFASIAAYVVSMVFQKTDVALLHVAIPVYALALTLMVTTAWATTGGPLAGAQYAAVGAILFYIGDLSLAVDAFIYVAPDKLPHAPLLTSGVYWLGQLGIATASRIGTRTPVAAAAAVRKAS